MHFRMSVLSTACVLALVALSGGAAAEGKFYPDGTNCSLLPDSELVACQNQIYARQLQSGESALDTGPRDQTTVPSSMMGSGTNRPADSDIVPGAETNAPVILTPVAPTLAPSGPTQLPGPEGTTVTP